MEKHISTKLTFCLVTVLLVLFLITPKLALATDYYVAGDTGLDTNDGSISTPWQTIQKAADTMVAGDTVNIKGELTYSGTNSCGVYSATVCLSESGTSGNYIIFQSWSGTGTPIIEGPNNGLGFGVSSASTGINYNKINGFLIKDALYGISVGGVGNIVSNNVIYDTSARFLSIGVTSGNILTGMDSTTTIYNNTIYGKYFGVFSNAGAAVIKNNIINSSTYCGIGTNTGYYVSLDIDYNNVYGSAVKNFCLGILQRGGHDLSVDPQFTSPGIYDFTLKNTSPLIDAGATLTDNPNDISRTTRPDGNAYDMGAYESSYSQASLPNSVATSDYTVSNNLMRQLAIYTGENTGDQFGMSNGYTSIAVGDINEDNYADVIVGGRHTVPNGGLYIFKGKTTPEDTSAINADIIIRGTFSGSRISNNSSLGDINGDGNKELLITDYNANAAYIFSTSPSFNSTDTSQAVAQISGPLYWSTSSSIIGDVNGDGYEDYIFDNVTTTPKGAYLFYGNSTLINKSYTNADVVYTTSDSLSFTRAGDINHDGYKDIVMGCSSCSGGNGAIYIFYGSKSLFNKDVSQADVILTGDSSESSLGSWVALSDVNSDGYDDILTVSSSKAYIFYGSNSLSSKTSGNADVVFTADSAYSECNSLSLAITGTDINNDGYADIIVSNSCLPRGYVFYGGSNLSSKNASQADLVYDIITNNKGYFGTPLEAGDVNGDGYNEIVVGAGQYNNRQGRAYLFGPPHGTPVVNLNSIGNTNNLTISGTVTDTLTVGGVEVSTDNGSWDTCTVSSGNFSCNLSSTLSDGAHSLRLRSKNSLGVYMATHEYTSASFTYDHTSPHVDWTDTSGSSKKYESQGGDNVYTQDTLPTFTFSKSSDTTSGLTRYEIIVDGNTYITNIDPNKPDDKDYREDDDKYVKYDGDNISVHAKKDSDKLVSGKAYKWKVRAVDSAGNSTDTAEKILRINTHEANFSGTWFPLSLLSVGGKNTSITSIHPEQIPSSLTIYNTTPTFYGIAPVGTQVTLRIEKENSTKSGRDLVLNTTSLANEASRFGINVTDKLAKQEYFVNLSAINTQGDYVEFPEFKLKVSSWKIIENINSQKEEAPVPEPTLTEEKPVEVDKPAPKQKHCFLFICW